MHLVRSVPLLTLASLLLAPASVGAQAMTTPPEPILVRGEGTEVFRALLKIKGVTPVKAGELSNLQRSDDVMVIALGDPSSAAFRRPLEPTNHIRTALSFGGSVLVAADTYTNVQPPWGNTSIEIRGERVVCDNPAATLPRNERRHCPYIAPAPIQRNAGALWKLFHRESPGNREEVLRRVATNSPSYLLVHNFHGDARFWPVGIMPIGSSLANRAAPPQGSAFVVGAELPSNRGGTSQFLAISDHSVFINQMLLEPDTDNLEFAYGVIDYLQGPTKRKRCIFIENGELKEQFDDLSRAAGSGNQSPIPQINMAAMQEWIVTQGNRLIDGIQRDNVINRALDRGFGVPTIARFFLVILTVLACWFVLRRAWSSRKPPDIPPSPTIAGAPTGPPGVFERRQKELMRRNNVYEPVRDLVRDYFESIGFHAEPGARPPKIVVSDAIRKPDSLRAAIRDLWKLAYGREQVMSVQQWRELEPFFERVRQAHIDGKWHFVASESRSGSEA